MPDFREVFSAYGGDYEATMKRFMDNEAIYLKILAMLSGDSNMEKLEVSLQRGELESAFEAAHTLKGITGNLGLTPFYDAVCKIVEPLRVKEPQADYPELYGQIHTEYQRTEALLAALQKTGGSAQ